MVSGLSFLSGFFSLRNFLCNTLKETAAGTFCKPISASRIMYGFSLYFSNLALEGTTATNVGFIMSLSVIFAPLLSIIVLQRPYKLSHLPIQLLVIFGMYLLCSNGGTFSFTREIYGHCLQQSASQEHWSLEKNL